ncbi:hypothetical protein V8E53_007843 [Lactarius tabidus]
MAERWKADADSILVFTGLFSAAVSSLLSVTIQDLQPNSGEKSAFYLQNIYQILADPNASNTTSSPISVNHGPYDLPFSSPVYAIWVNSLWFSSLVLSLSCACLATLLQQWIRRYLTATQPRYNPHKQAIIREFFVEGVERLHLPWMVEALPALLHISLFLFFSGLVIFVFNIHLTLFSVVLWWIALLAISYGVITLMPIFSPDSPYYSPLSSSAWVIVHGIFFGTFWCFDLLKCFGLKISQRAIYLRDLSRRRLAKGVGKTAKHTVLHIASELYPRALARSFNSLHQDHELEQFFASIPGLCVSKAVRSFDRSHAAYFDISFGRRTSPTTPKSSLYPSDAYRVPSHQSVHLSGRFQRSVGWYLEFCRVWALSLEG